MVALFFDGLLDGLDTLRAGGVGFLRLLGEQIQAGVRQMYPVGPVNGRNVGFGSARSGYCAGRGRVDRPVQQGTRY